MGRTFSRFFDRLPRAFAAAVLLAVIPTPAPADVVGCGALFREDRALREALPPRVRALLESARGEFLLSDREKAWEDFFEALDRGWETPGKDFDANLGGYHLRLRFRRGGGEAPRLRIVSVEPIASGPNSAFRAGYGIFEVIAAHVGWVAKKRHEGVITEITFAAYRLPKSGDLELLESLGFERRGVRGIYCGTVALFGAALGWQGGFTVFSALDAGVEGSAPEDQRRAFRKWTLGGAAAGAGASYALLCGKRIDANYSLTIESAPAMIGAP